MVYAQSSSNSSNEYS